jgi:hypothetical protein
MILFIILNITSFNDNIYQGYIYIYIYIYCILSTKQNIKKFILIYTHNQKQLHLYLRLDLGFYFRSLLSLHIVIKRLLMMTNHPI